jgi:hypothetical protein
VAFVKGIGQLEGAAESESDSVVLPKSKFDSRIDNGIVMLTVTKEQCTLSFIFDW